MYRGRLPNGLKPMLASKFHEATPEQRAPPLLVSPKIDGCRCVATRHGLFTRSGRRVYGAEHVRARLRPVFAADPAAVLDGELFRFPKTRAAEKENFEFVSSTVRKGLHKKKAKSREAQAQLRQLSLFVFDVMRHQPVSTKMPAVVPLRTPFYRRLLALQTLARVRRWPTLSLRRYYFPPRSHPPVVAMSYIGANSDAAVARAHARLARLGFEGVVARSAANVYRPDHRSASLMKVVARSDAEYQVFRFGGNLNGQVTFAECKTTSGRFFRARVYGVSAAVARRWRQERLFHVGMWATLRYMRLTRHGVPRAAVVKSVRGAKGQMF